LTETSFIYMIYIQVKEKEWLTKKTTAG